MLLTKGPALQTAEGESTKHRQTRHKLTEMPATLALGVTGDTVENYDQLLEL